MFRANRGKLSHSRSIEEKCVTEAPLSLEPYKKPGVLYRAQTIGGVRAIEEMQAGIITELLSGPRLPMLDAQKSINPLTYGVVEFADDIATSIWGDLSAAPRFRRGLQIAFLDKVREILISFITNKKKQQSKKQQK